jgi:polygalacturonase
LSGTVVLLSGVTLNITSDATLLGSPNVTDFPTDESEWALIFAQRATNISILGGGVIDGQADLFIGGWSEPDNKFVPLGWLPGVCQGECRPRNIRLRSCSGILLSNITVQNSPDWTIHLENSTDILVDGLTQYGSHLWPNNDGIDIDSCQNVVVRNSSFNTGDDGVCPKGTAGYQDFRNVHVYNCTIRSRSGAIKFGSNTDVNMYDALFEDIVIWDSNRGLAIQQRSNGTIWNITYRNIDIEVRYNPPGWWGSAEPIYISSMPRSENMTVGASLNISFINITARAENSVFLSGRAPGEPIVNISLTNVSVLIDKWSNYSYPAHSYVPTTAVNPDLFFAPVDGVYIERGVGIALNNVTVTYNNTNVQPFWSHVCFNTSFAGTPVECESCVCNR